MSEEKSANFKGPRALKYVFVLLLTFAAWMVMISSGAKQMQGMVETSIESLARNIKPAESYSVFDHGAAGSLPEPVRNYLAKSVVSGSKNAGSLKMVLKGSYEAASGKPRLELGGMSFITTQKPGAVYVNKTNSNKFWWYYEREMFSDGEGLFTVKLLSNFNKGDFSGGNRGPGALARYLVESVWYPTILADPGLVKWEPVSADSARASITVDGITAHAVFYFGPDGFVAKVETDSRERFDYVAETFTEGKFAAEYSGYSAEPDGFVVPHKVKWFFTAKTGGAAGEILDADAMAFKYNTPF